MYLSRLTQNAMRTNRPPFFVFNFEYTSITYKLYKLLTLIRPNYERTLPAIDYLCVETA